MKWLKIPEKSGVFILLGTLFIFFLIISYLQEGTYGGPDDISHYNISSNAFKYPWLILDLWGKPLFTLLTAPFARFGLSGVIIFNIIAGLFTCYFTYQIACIRQYKDPWLVILFICFAPIYTTMIVTGMTEILFGFALIFAAYLFFKEKYISSSVFVSFLPFIRNEGIIIIPIYLVAYVWYKKWKAVPFLITGILLLSFIGSLHYDDFLWIIHKWPYGDTSDIYGSGSIFFYLMNATRILGIPLIILFVPGLIYSLIRFFSGFSLKPSHKLTELLLILGPLSVYIAAHSYAWYKGIAGSGGLIRFMTCIIPFAALYSLQGINWFTHFPFMNRLIKTGIYVVLLYFVIITPFKIYSIPRRFSEQEKITYQASQWLKQHALDKGIIYYVDPSFQHFMGVNCHDQTRVIQYLPNPENPGENIPEGSFIAWDAHFGANEGRISLENLINSPSLRLIKVFKPKNYFWVLGKNYYNIFIFRKDTTVEKNHNFNQLNRLSFYDTEKIKLKSIIRHLPLDSDTLTNLPDTVLDGRACVMLDTSQTYSYTIRMRGNEIDEMYTTIRASIYYYPVESLTDGSCILVLSINRGKKRLLYHSTIPFYLYHRPGMWNLMITEALLPKEMDQEHEISVYIWQHKHQEIYVNDFKVELFN